jgi:hypothetical protein
MREQSRAEQCGGLSPFPYSSDSRWPRGKRGRGRPAGGGDAVMGRGDGKRRRHSQTPNACCHTYTYSFLLLLPLAPRAALFLPFRLASGFSSSSARKELLLPRYRQ